ncbi:MAG: hypothetical protein KC636_19880 [Myxococcales bacterium]|nr:hypothetical protein [Myxococcales bacterium]
MLEAGRGHAWREVVLPIGLLVLVGPALPVASGWLWPVIALALVALGLFARRSQEIAIDGLPRSAEIALVALVGAVALITGTVIARAIGAVFIRFPAAIPVVVVWILAVGIAWVRGRARALGLVVVILLVPLAASWGVAHEARGIDARGFAHSGPIYGIHPFQSTAVRIDGFGPHDIPINDFVEPDGHRGYSPEALAANLERTLHAIAETRYAEGPARARRAFGEATVTSVVTPGVQERLDKPPDSETQPRLVVTSGGVGPQSRVEFRCPGAPVDPRPLPADPVTEQMCPRKYTTEASAGLGLTGRWSGYFEARGNEQLGLSRLIGQTRSDDAQGRRLVIRELRWWAALLWIGVAGLAALGGRALEPVARLGGFWAAVTLLTLVGLLTWQPGHGLGTIGAIESAPTAHVSAWLAALVLCACGSGRARAPAGLSIVVVLAVTVALTGAIQAISWITPALYEVTATDAIDGRWLAFERFVLPFGARLADAVGLELAHAEALVAGALTTALIGAFAALLGELRAAAQRFEVGGWRIPVIVALLAASGAGLAWSRQTWGGALLLPAAIALLVVARSVQSRGIGPQAASIAGIALAAVSLVQAAGAADRPGPFLTVTLAAGWILVMAAGVLVWGAVKGRRADRSNGLTKPTAGPRNPATGG